MQPLTVLVFSFGLANLTALQALPLAPPDTLRGADLMQVRNYCAPGLKPIGHTGDCRPIRRLGKRQRAGNTALAPTRGERAVDREINTICRRC